MLCLLRSVTHATTTRGAGPHARPGGPMTRHLAAAALALTLLASADASAFCGFYVSGADTKLFNDATNVVLLRDGTRTVLSMQNAYKGPPEAFAMVVPVPVVVHQEKGMTLLRDVFDRVDQ